MKNSYAKPKFSQKSSMDFSFNVRVESHRIVAFCVYVILALSGLYVAFFGFRVFRLLMVIVGFYVSYYLILFILTEFQLYNSNSILHQVILFISSVFLGFFIAITCYMLEKINFIIFGTAIGSVVSLFYVQFFVDFSEFDDKIALLIVYLVASFLFILSSFFIFDQTIIWGSALVGSIIFTINVGVIFGDFKSFEEREVLPKDAWSDFINYIIATLIIFLFGMITQYFIRSRIVKKFNNSRMTLDDLEIRFLWHSIAPLGVPVVPPVY